jgi:hypothetical protein
MPHNIATPDDCALVADARREGYFRGKVITVQQVRKTFRCSTFHISCKRDCSEYHPQKKRSKKCPSTGSR